MKRAEFDLDDSDDDSGDAKRSRMGMGSGAGLGGGLGGGLDTSAESQLEEMLAAGGGGGINPFGGGGINPFGGGIDKGKGKGKFKGEGLGTGSMDDDPKVETTKMDFSKLSRDLEPSSVQVQRELVEYLMTTEHRKLLTEETGANVEWVPEEARVLLTGSPEQVKRGQRLLARVMMHCRWGYSEAKVRRLIKPRQVESVLVRLSPMNTLKPYQKSLSTAQPVLAIGKEKSNNVFIKDELISRTHCILELDEDRGAVYILDCSTNGTFLNGVRLPSKTVGKVLLSHGDEILLKDPAGGDQEFGYIVNVDELTVREEVKLEAPRRLLSAEEMSSVGRDFS